MKKFYQLIDQIRAFFGLPSSVIFFKKNKRGWRLLIYVLIVVGALTLGYQIAKQQKQAEFVIQQEQISPELS